MTDRAAPRGGLAIFVKTPDHSPVKTRLAATRGTAYAHAWYRLAAAAVASVAGAARERCGLAAYWAVAEPAARGAWPGLPVLDQGDGDLGARMARVHAELVARHGCGILVGADAPQLGEACLVDAAAWLGAAAPRLAIGPARDGGFWLYGANLVAPPGTWARVAYSQPRAARDLRAAMASLGEWRELECLVDVDRADDLASVRDALEALPRPTPAQRALADWMRAHEPSRP